MEPLRALEEALGHEFQDHALLRLALIHRSYLAEHIEPESYERLEFLGDAVLQLSVTDYLYRSFPELQEGELAKIRASVVNERALARIARRFGVDDALLLGKGEEQTGGRNKPSILADAMEALLGAVYLDRGFAAAQAIVIRHWSELIDERAVTPGLRDYKTRLQEALAQRSLRPEYEVTESGPEHAKIFEASVHADGFSLGIGVGTSKKRAEQEAARIAFDSLPRQFADSDDA